MVKFLLKFNSPRGAWDLVLARRAPKRNQSFFGTKTKSKHLKTTTTVKERNDPLLNLKDNDSLKKRGWQCQEELHVQEKSHSVVPEKALHVIPFSQSVFMLKFAWGLGKGQSMHACSAVQSALRPLV